MKVTLATPETSGRFHHYAAVVESPEIEWLGTIPAPFSAATLDRVQGIIISDEWHAPTRVAIAECKKRGIPVFHVIDGILEWRNLFENPRSTEAKNGSPLFQPVLADHTFCMGPVQKWQLEWLGNASIHATGLPRLDGMPVSNCRPRSVSNPPRLLVATANTPWFNTEQRQRFMAEFSRLVGLCLAETSGSTPDFRCIWRVAEVAASALGLVADSSGSAADALASCDALLTTPSTFAVEAMLMGVPTMLFDPFACPAFIPAAWNATSAETAFAQIPSLLRPLEARCRLQDSIRSLIAPTDRGATNRVRECILQVVRNGRVQPVEGSPAFSPASPLHDFNSKEHPPQFSPADVHGLLATLPALDAKIAGQNERIEQLQKQLYTPNLKDGFRAMSRAFWNTFRSSGK
jgi:hypothetical protein